MENVPMIATSVAVAAGILAAYLWLKARATDLRAASEMLDNHYAATQRLVSDATVPQSVVDFSVWFAGQVGRPRLARRLVFDLAFGQTTKQRGTTTSALEADLQKLTVAQRDLFSTMIVHGTISSAASDPVLSQVYLHSLTMFFSRSGASNDKSISVERANTAALDLSAHHFCPA